PYPAKEFSILRTGPLDVRGPLLRRRLVQSREKDALSVFGGFGHSVTSFAFGVHLQCGIAGQITPRSAWILRAFSADGVRDVFFQLGMEPGSRVRPVAIRRCRRDAEGVRGLGNRQTGKVAELDEAGLERVHFLEVFESFVDGQHVQGRLWGGDREVLEVLALAAATTALA